jgi:hypothetical protein
MSGGIVVGRVRGIEISVHYTWVFAFALIAWSLAEGLFPSDVPGWSTTTYWVVGAVSALGLFASVLVSARLAGTVDPPRLEVGRLHCHL